MERGREGMRKKRGAGRKMAQRIEERREANIRGSQSRNKYK